MARWNRTGYELPSQLVEALDDIFKNIVEVRSDGVLIGPNGPISVSGGGVQHNEDTTHLSGDAGQLVLAVRNDSDAPLTSGNGVYGALTVTADGKLKIDLTSLLQFDANGRLEVAVEGGAAVDISKNEDDPHVSGDKGYPSLGVRNDNAGTTFAGTDGDYSNFAVDNRGRIFIALSSGNLGPQKTEDAAHASGDQGILGLAVRSDGAGTTFTDTDGDYSPLAVDNRGRLHVSLGDSALGPTKLEDDPHVTGDRGVFVLGVRQDADTPPAADGDYQGFLFNQFGRLKVSTSPADAALVTGNITASAQTVSLNVNRLVALAVAITGTFAGINLTFEASLNSTDGSNGSWFAVQGLRSNAATIESTSGALGSAPAYLWRFSVNSCAWFRVRSTAYTSGTGVVSILGGVEATEPAVAAQQAGTWSVAISGTTSVTPGTAAANLGKAADAAHASGDTGVFALAVRRDTDGTQASASGDYDMMQTDARGWLKVQAAANATPVDRSSTITTGGTAQQLAAANTVRRALTIFNRSVGDLWYSLTGTAAVNTAGSYLLSPGETIFLDTPGFGAISIIGATTGQEFTATEA